MDSGRETPIERVYWAGEARALFEGRCAGLTSWPWRGTGRSVDATSQSLKVVAMYYSLRRICITMRI